MSQITQHLEIMNSCLFMQYIQSMVTYLHFSLFFVFLFSSVSRKIISNRRMNFLSSHWILSLSLSLALSFSLSLLSLQLDVLCIKSIICCAGLLISQYNFCQIYRSFTFFKCRKKIEVIDSIRWLLNTTYY